MGSMVPKPPLWNLSESQVSSNLTQCLFHTISCFNVQPDSTKQRKCPFLWWWTARWAASCACWGQDQMTLTLQFAGTAAGMSIHDMSVLSLQSTARSSQTHLGSWLFLHLHQKLSSYKSTKKPTDPLLEKFDSTMSLHLETFLLSVLVKSQFVFPIKKELWRLECT